MKINHIQIRDFLGLRAADLPLATPVTLVAGPNGAGKSSLQEAVRMALLGEPTRVSLKKEYGELVHAGQPGGSIAVDVFDDTKGEAVFTLALPAGAHTGPALPSVAAYLLDAGRFARVDADTRRKLLFDLTGCAATPATVKQALQQRGADAAKIEAILPLVRAGFPEAAKEAAARARDAKSAWRTVTGEAYGDKKAASYSVAKPAVDPLAITAVGAELEETDQALADAQQQLGALQAERKAQQGQHDQIVQLQERAGRLDRIRAKLAADEVELGEWDAKLAEARVKAAGKVVGSTCGCPECGAALVFHQGVLSLHQPTQTAQADAAAAQLPAYQQARDLCARAVENGRRDLATAQAAESLLADLNASAASPVTEQDLARVQDMIAQLRTSRKELASRQDALWADQRAAADADGKTEAAARHHADVQAWLLIADALAPDGIPGELLAAAIEPVNKLLLGRSAMAGWALVQLSRDMDIAAAGRPYALLSESEQWRADALLAIVLAELSGMRLVMLDRMDVLDLKGRGELITLLDELTYQGGAETLDTVIVCGTLKQAPARLPDTMRAFWVEGGVVAPGVREQERMAA